MCVYLVEAQSQDLLEVLGELGVVDHVVDQFLLTGQGAVVGDIRHGILMAGSARSRHLEAGSTDKDVLSTLLGRHCSCTIRLAYSFYRQGGGEVSWSVLWTVWSGRTYMHVGTMDCDYCLPSRTRSTW